MDHAMLALILMSSRLGKVSGLAEIAGMQRVALL